MEMQSTQPDIAAVARAIGGRTRATILSVLFGGQWLTATELAKAGHITPSTASEHLRRLTSARLIIDRRSGRHRYFALAGADVAHLLESLACFAGRPIDESSTLQRPLSPLRLARSCYDHLAGRLGVTVTMSLRENGVLAGPTLEVTERGEITLRQLGVDIASLREGPRPLTRACLDWSERQDHVAGAVGAALLSSMLERHWVTRVAGTRALRVTLRGRDALYRILRLQFE